MSVKEGDAFTPVKHIHHANTNSFFSASLIFSPHVVFYYQMENPFDEDINVMKMRISNPVKVQTCRPLFVERTVVLRQDFTGKFIMDPQQFTGHHFATKWII